MTNKSTIGASKGGWPLPSPIRHSSFVIRHSPTVLFDLDGTLIDSVELIVRSYHHATTTHLGLTLPFLIYGIFRYLYLVHQKEGGGSPAEMLLNDRPLLLCVALWALVVALIIYGPMK